MRHVIVGNGVAGVTAAQELVRSDPAAEVHIFGAEPYPYYRRPLLWEFIAGQLEQDALYFRPAEWYAGRGIHLHLGTQVTSLDPSAHRITLADGSSVQYDRLLLATGGRPSIPACEGTGNEGVFTLRTLDDALAIKAHAQQVSTAVVIGGGLLGLETARALHTAGLDVTVVEFFPYLLPRQLDLEGAQVLQSLLEAQGLHVLTGGTTEAILGDGRATGIRLKDGRLVPGELVLFSTGIRSEVALAQAAGLSVNRGIVVDQRLQTSVEDIFAAGDAAEFEGRVYGIIPPAIEQAAWRRPTWSRLGVPPTPVRSPPPRSKSSGPSWPRWENAWRRETNTPTCDTQTRRPASIARSCCVEGASQARSCSTTKSACGPSPSSLSKAQTSRPTPAGWWTTTLT